MAKSKNIRLKKSHTLVEYTPEQMMEVSKCMDDPIYFMKNYVIIKEPMKGQIPFALFDYQEQMVRNFIEHRFSINLLPRQVGKTEVISAYLLWFVLFHNTKTVIVTSNVLKSAKEIITKISDAYELVPDWLKPGISEDDFNKESLSFDNKSRIIAQSTSKDTGRGYAVSILYCDEFAIVQEHIQKDFYGSVFPVLSTGGQMIISSTAGTDTDLFSEIWRAAELGTNTFHPFTVPWNARPGRTEAFKQEVISNFGIQRWLREYENVFSSSDTTLIDTKIVSEIEAQIKGLAPAFTIEEQPFYKKINQDATYLVGVDPGTGTGSDYTVIEVVEFPSMEQVMEYRTNTVSHSEIYAYLKKTLRFLEHFAKEVYFSVESNGVGQGILALYDNDDEQPDKAILISDDKKDALGMFTTDKNKIPSCLLLKNLFESKSLKFYSPIILKELKSYKRSKGSYEAKKGATDDCIAATLIILRILQEISMYDSRAYHKLYTINIGDSSDAWIREAHRIDGEEYNGKDEYDEQAIPMPIVT